MTQQIDIEGPITTFDSYNEAFQFLKKHNYGYLNHRDMEDSSMVFLNSKEELCFYDGHYGTVHVLSPAEIAEFGDEAEWPTHHFKTQHWAYLPASEIALLLPPDFFDQIRNLDIQIPKM